MSYDWKRYLEFSKNLVVTPFFCVDEDVPLTSYRVILSRIYYAAFHIARSFLMRHKLPIPTIGAEHEKIIQAFKTMVKKDKDFRTACKKIGGKLERLKIDRVDADYEDEYTPEKKYVLKGLKDAQDIMTSLDQLEAAYFSKE